jgi:hypothetical protein
VRVEWTDEFDLWLSRIEERAEGGDEHAERQLDYIAAELQILRDVTAPPTWDAETAQLMRVRQSRRYEVWRVSHRFDAKVAIRLICWFPPQTDSVVVTVFGGDKKRIGDAVLQQRRNPRRRGDR